MSAEDDPPPAVADAMMEDTGDDGNDKDQETHSPQEAAGRAALTDCIGEVLSGDDTRMQSVLRQLGGVLGVNSIRGMWELFQDDYNSSPVKAATTLKDSVTELTVLEAKTLLSNVKAAAAGEGGEESTGDADTDVGEVNDPVELCYKLKARMGTLTESTAYAESPMELVAATIDSKVVGHIFVSDNRDQQIVLKERGKYKPAHNFFFCSPCNNGAVPVNAPSGIVDIEDKPPLVKQRGVIGDSFEARWSEVARLDPYACCISGGLSGWFSGAQRGNIENIFNHVKTRHHMLACKRESHRLMQQGGPVARPMLPDGVRDVTCAWPPEARMHLYGMSFEEAEEEYQGLVDQVRRGRARRRQQVHGTVEGGRRVSPRTSPSGRPRAAGPAQIQRDVSPELRPRGATQAKRGATQVQGGTTRRLRSASPGVGQRTGGPPAVGLPPRAPAPPQQQQPQQQQQRIEAAHERMPLGGVWDVSEIDLTGGQGSVGYWKCRLCNHRHNVTRCCACGALVKPQLMEGGMKRYTCQQCNAYDYGFQ